MFFMAFDFSESLVTTFTFPLNVIVCRTKTRKSLIQTRPCPPSRKGHNVWTCKGKRIPSHVLSTNTPLWTAKHQLRTQKGVLQKAKIPILVICSRFRLKLYFLAQWKNILFQILEGFSIDSWDVVQLRTMRDQFMWSASLLNGFRTESWRFAFGRNTSPSN